MNTMIKKKENLHTTFVLVNYDGRGLGVYKPIYRLENVHIKSGLYNRYKV